MPLNAHTLNMLKSNAQQVELSGALEVELGDLLSALLHSETQEIVLGTIDNDNETIISSIPFNSHIKKVTLKELPQKQVDVFVNSLTNRKEPLLVCADNLDQDTIYAIENNPNLNLRLSNAGWTFTYTNHESIEHFEFFYKDKLMLKWVRNGYSIDEIWIDDAVKDIPAPKILPYSHLTNELWRKIAAGAEKNLLAEIINNYFSGLIPDFLNYELDHSLTIETSYLGDELANELKSILTNEGIKVCENPFNDYNLWLRDIFKCFGDGTYQINEGALTEDEIINAGLLLAKDPQSFLRQYDSPIISQIYIGSSCEDYDGEKMKSVLNDNNINFESKELLEGGNILTIKINNKIYIIIGENSKILETIFRSELNLNEEILNHFKNKPNKTNKKHYSLFEEETAGKVCRATIKEAKLAVAEALKVNPEQLIWIANPAYHIDLMLTAMDGYVLLNSFELTQQILANSEDIEDQKIAVQAGELHQTYGAMLKEIKNKLESKGIKVVEVPGVLYGKDDQNEYICHANFMNGYAGKGKNGSFFMTLASENKRISDAFASILKDHNTDNIYFVGKDKFIDGVSLPHILLNKYRGSLRCLSVPGNSFGRLEVQKPNSLEPLESILINPQHDSTPKNDWSYLEESFFGKRKEPSSLEKDDTAQKHHKGNQM